MLLTPSGNNEIRWQPGERLSHLFEQRCDQFAAANQADHAALLIQGKAITFAKLDLRANQMARYLIQQGLRPGDRVALLLDKSHYTYAALLAVIKLNLCFVPLDVGFPADRISFICQDAEVRNIITLTSFQTQLRAVATPLILLDEDEALIASQATNRLEQANFGKLENELCYIIYTSGTTGKPKGVCIEHASICNFVRVAAEQYGLRPDDRVYQGMTIAFDFSVEEIWVPWMVGATIVPGSGNQLVGADLARFLQENQVTGLCCVPTLLATLEEDLPALRWLLVSGEACPHDLVLRWHRPGRLMLNAYGPTETTVTSTLTELYPNKPVTIGKPLLTYTAVMLAEESDRMLAQGELGEIGIAGVCLAKGYLKRDDLTEKKFIPDFIGIPNNPSQRIYRTGDLGRINADHEIEYLGRIDTQVKIRGYRIELTEIESVFMQMPQVAQAVVEPVEMAGVKELVAYYTLKQGASDLDRQETAEVLRNRLPTYMIPAYLEKLTTIPLLPSNKADRKKLPTPVGPRFQLGNDRYVAPRSEMEKRLVASLGIVLKTDRISVEADFFDELGAHSFLMAQFCAQIRQNNPGVTISMREVYTHRTIATLAEYLQQSDTTGLTVAQRQIKAIPPPYRIPTNWEYYGCGLLQLLYYCAFAWYFIVLTEAFTWVIATEAPFITHYAEAVLFGLTTFLIMTMAPIIAKWVFIGTWQAETFPIWSLRYFRFWAIKHLIQTSPMAFFGGSPLYNVYLRLLGAKIGKNVVIQARVIPPCTDLLTIGENTILRKESILLGYKAQSNYIHTGPITIGANTFVGEASVLDINSVMEDDTQLGHASSLQAGQVVPQGKRFHGSPAQETTTDYCPIPAQGGIRWRRLVYSFSQVLSLFLLILPAPILLIDYTVQFFSRSHEQATAGVFLPDAALGGWDIYFHNLYLLIQDVWAAEQVSWAATVDILILSLVLFFGALFFGLFVVYFVPRLLNLLLQTRKVYPLFGFHYYIFGLITRLSNSPVYNALFGDSSYIVYFLRLIGYNLTKVVQTGSNFGMVQKHETPFLCTIGTGTIVSDGLSMINLQMSSNAFQLTPVVIGAHNFLGNNIHYPADGKTGDNCLLATKVMVPIDGPVRHNVGLLGSPSFEIPRTVDRDKLPSSYLNEETRQQRLRQKTLHNTISILGLLAVYWFYLFVVLLLGYSSHVLGGDTNLLYYFVFLLVAACFTIVYYASVDWVTLGFRRMKPQSATIYDKEFWQIERYWKLSNMILSGLFPGTPFKTLVARLLGVKLGRKVFDDGCHLTEKTLVTIGDYCNLNEASTLQSHSLEDGMFKSDVITIGTGCTVGCQAFVHYGVNMGENVILDPDSFLMKGETVEANSIWRGNPAKVHTDLPEEPTTIQLPAGQEIDWARIFADLIQQRNVDTISATISTVVKEDNTKYEIVIARQPLVTNAASRLITTSTKAATPRTPGWKAALWMLLLGISALNSYFLFSDFSGRFTLPGIVSAPSNASIAVATAVPASLIPATNVPTVPQPVVVPATPQATVASATTLPPLVSAPPALANRPSALAQFFTSRLPTMIEAEPPAQESLVPRCTHAVDSLENVTIPHGRLLAPYEIFTKIWKVKNEGTCAIFASYELVVVGESEIPVLTVAPVQYIGSAQEGVLSVTFQAPGTPGEHFSHWRLRAPSGEMFGDMFIEIKVATP